MKSIKKTLCVVLIFGSSLKPSFAQSISSSSSNEYQQESIGGLILCAICGALLTGMHSCSRKVGDHLGDRINEKF